MLLIKAVVSKHFFVIFANIVIMIRWYNKIQVCCVKLYCLWLYPVAVI